MTYLAEFSVEPVSFPFGSTLQRMPEIEIEVDRIVPTGERAFQYFWVYGCDTERFMELAEDEPEVVETRLLEEVEEVSLFCADWRPDGAIVERLRDLEVTILAAVGTVDHWHFEVRAADREAIVAFFRIFNNAGAPIEMRRLADYEEAIEGRSLTQTQRETLVAAFEAGYFESPRNVDQSELAERFDVSRRAISDRLRRAVRNLVGDTLPVER